MKFTQEQLRNFARYQRGALRDAELETLPGVLLAHKKIPVNSVGNYVLGGKHSNRACVIHDTSLCPTPRPPSPHLGPDRNLAKVS